MYSLMRKEALRKKRCGFSLVELMVVVMIIIVLGGAGTMIAGRVTDRTKYARAEKDLETLAGAFTQYINGGGTIAGLGISGETIINKDVPDSVRDALQPYISKDLRKYNTPWDGVNYVIEYAYNATTGEGTIVINVPATAAAGLAAATVKQGANSALNRITDTALERLIYKQ